jgi:hypothetical protein
MECRHEFDAFHFCVHCTLSREQAFNPARLPSVVASAARSRREQEEARRRG